MIDQPKFLLEKVAHYEPPHQLTQIHSNKNFESLFKPLRSKRLQPTRARLGAAASMPNKVSLSNEMSIEEQANIMLEQMTHLQRYLHDQHHGRRHDAADAIAKGKVKDGEKRLGSARQRSIVIKDIGAYVKPINANYIHTNHDISSSDVTQPAAPLPPILQNKAQNQGLEDTSSSKVETHNSKVLESRFYSNPLSSGGPFKITQNQGEFRAGYDQVASPSG